MALQVIGRYKQDVEEKKKFTFDYSAWLDTGESVSSATSEVTPVTTPALVVSAITTTATTVAFFVAGGVAGNTYTVVIEAVTDAGQEKRDAIKFKLDDWTP